MTSKTVPAEQFVALLAANVDNVGLSDEAFRAMVRNSLPVVQGQAAPVCTGRSQFDDTSAWTQR